MQLLDRYLASVRSCLPEEQRDDIINELAENLRSQIEDHETERNRPLTEKEIEGILKRHGHPLVVAGRYRQDQRSVSFGKQLIGPVLFPFYLRVLKFNLGLTSLVIACVFLGLFLAGHSFTLGDALPPFFYQFVIQFTVITAIFSFADRHWRLHPDSWDPKNLKHPWHPVFAIQSAKKGPEKDPRQVSRFDSIAHFIGLFMAIAWLKIAKQAPFMIFGPAAAFIKAAPVWHLLYVPVLILWLGGMLRALINLARPDWVRLPVIYNAISQAAWIAMFLFLLKTGPWVVLTASSAAKADDYRRTAEVLNQITLYGLAFLAVISAIGLIRSIVSLSRGPKPGSASRVPG